MPLIAPLAFIDLPLGPAAGTVGYTIAYGILSYGP